MNFIIYFAYGVMCAEYNKIYNNARGCEMRKRWKYRRGRGRGREVWDLLRRSGGAREVTGRGSRRWFR